MKTRNILISFACDFISFLLEKVDLSKIDNIILFGSVARGTSTKDSDVDLFVDTKDKKIEKQIEYVMSEFYDSKKYKEYWKLLGIDNKIKCIAGELKKWKLRRSIISEGITLYGKYVERIKGNLFVLFTIELKGKRSKKVSIWRKLYGYKQKIKNKMYKFRGLIKTCDGKKLGLSIFVIPIANAGKIISFLRKNKVKHTLIELQSDML